MILVAGATGALGSEICRKLRERGSATRALVRASSAADKVARLKALGVETVVGDLKDRASLAAACQGVEAVISTVSMIMTGQSGDSFEATDGAGNIALIDAASAARVSRFVFVSFDTGATPDAPLVSAKRSVEAHLVQSGLSYTILHPTLFMESWLGPMLFADPAAGAAKRLGDGTRSASYVAVRDVAEVAVRCVAFAPAHNRVLSFGAEALSQRDALAIFTEVFETHFDVTEIPEQALEAQWSNAADPMSKSFSALMLGVARGSLQANRLDPAEFPIRWTSVREFVQEMRRA